MGEPGTKEVLVLEDLETVGSGRTGRKHVLSILAENKLGVLARIAACSPGAGSTSTRSAVGPTWTTCPCPASR